MFKMKFLLLILATGCCWANTSVRFDNYRVYRVRISNLRQLNALRDLQNQGFEFWGEVGNGNRSVDIMVAPNQVSKFQTVLKLFKMEQNILIKNVQESIDQEQKLSSRSSKFNWNSYQTLEQINAWLAYLEKRYPRVVKVVVGGSTYANRSIYGVHVSFKPGNRAIFLEGGINSREWIAPATVTYILNEVLTSTNPRVRMLVESRDWYVFPIFNPDGYVITHTQNRFWTKTIKPYGKCYGVDANRNWGYCWMESGPDLNHCESSYAGPSAFSEIETKSLSEYITRIAPQLDGYFAFHAYSQMILIPFGHSGLEVPKNNGELLQIGNRAAYVLARRYSTRYQVGNIPNITTDIDSGSSGDWVAGVHKVKMVYTFMLRDTGSHGYTLPTNQIIPTGQETFDALFIMINELNALP